MRPLAIGTSGILLAGGASRRFGREKLLEPLAGAPLFHHPLRALLATCDDVVVVLAPDAPEPPLPLDARVRLVRDAVPYGGPLVGTRTGLGHVRGIHALLAAGDMPGLREAILDLLKRRAIGTARGAVVLADGEGLRPLPAIVRVDAATQAADAMLKSGERRLRALITALDPEVLDESVWAAADPGGDWRRDVDLPADLPGTAAH
jgi:molybdenum cofactor guanylyltransferase